MRAFPRVGALREDVVIERRDSQGEWVAVAAPKAEMVPITGREFQAAESTHPAATVRWRMRYRAEIADLDTRIARLVHGGNEYQISYIEDAQNAHVELFIVTERVAR